MKIERSLSINRFSCLEHVEIFLGKLNILIGPQGSGKSLLCKILYFCQMPFGNIAAAVEENLTFSQYRDQVSKEFVEWFPPSAWGSSKFSINYSSGKYSISIRRSSGRGGVKDYVSVEFSDTFEELFSVYTSAVKKERQSRRDAGRDSSLFSIGLYHVRHAFARKMAFEFGEDLTEEQTYIPAGRAFFTTVGKAVAAFDQSRMFDPITGIFGRLFIGIRERMSYNWPSRHFPRKADAQAWQFLHRKIEKVFGGKVRAQKDDLVVTSPDGRTVPLNALSSGQQELLPLWVALDYFYTHGAYQETGSSILYLEEPEAHLFPSAQADLVEVFAALTTKKNSKSQIILSTHSPYILAKSNNLIKAGAIGYRRKAARQKRVSDVIPKDIWLLKNDVRAYAVKSGTVIDIIGDDGLISSDYIDGISLEILEEYEKLLDVVYEK